MPSHELWGLKTDEPTRLAIKRASKRRGGAQFERGCRLTDLALAQWAENNQTAAVMLKKTVRGLVFAGTSGYRTIGKAIAALSLPDPPEDTVMTPDNGS